MQQQRYTQQLVIASGMPTRKMPMIGECTNKSCTRVKTRFVKCYTLCSLTILYFVFKTDRHRHTTKKLAISKNKRLMPATKPVPPFAYGKTDVQFNKVCSRCNRESVSGMMN